MSTLKLALSFGAALAAAPAFGAATAVYKITDAQGHVLYQNIPPSSHHKNVKVLRFDPRAYVVSWDEFRRGTAVMTAHADRAKIARNARLIDALIARQPTHAAPKGSTVMGPRSMEPAAEETTKPQAHAAPRLRLRLFPAAPRQFQVDAPRRGPDDVAL